MLASKVDLFELDTFGQQPLNYWFKSKWRRKKGARRMLSVFCRQISIKTKNWVASASSLRALKAQASLALHDSLHKVGKKSAFQCVACCCCCCEKWKLAIKVESSIGWCCKCKNQHISWHQERKANFTGPGRLLPCKDKMLGVFLQVSEHLEACLKKVS